MLSKTSLELQPGVRTSFGAGVVEKLGKRVTSLAHERAFIVTDKGVVGSGIIDRVQASLKKARIAAGYSTASPPTRPRSAWRREARSCKRTHGPW